MLEVIVKHYLGQRRCPKTPVQRGGGVGELEAMRACPGAQGFTGGGESCAGVVCEIYTVMSARACHSLMMLIVASDIVPFI